MSNALAIFEAALPQTVAESKQTAKSLEGIIRDSFGSHTYGRYAKGLWVIGLGADKDTINDELAVFVLDQAKVAKLAWKDAKGRKQSTPIKTQYVSVNEPFPKESTWPEDLQNNPYVETQLGVPAVALLDGVGVPVLFEGSSVGWRGALGALAKATREALEGTEAVNAQPLVKLGTRKYMHAQHGEQNAPVLEFVKLVTPKEIEELLAGQNNG